jgi:CRP-like cAMP-binding protein
MNLIAHFEDARNAVCIQAGQTIFKQGQRGTVMYVLIDGVAEILVGGHSVEFAEGGALLGEMALVDDEPRSATVVARTACKLVPIPQAQFDLLVRETPEFARCVMMSMAERLRRMNQRMPMRLIPGKPARNVQEERLAA